MKTFICFLFIILTTSVSAEDGVCREGWYGKSCDLKCSNSCRPLQTYPCNKETGRCSEGCKIGYFGINCEKKCNCTGSCIQETGACIGDNPPQDNSQDNQDNQDNQNNQNNQANQQKNDSQEIINGWRITAIIFIVLLIMVLIFLVVAIFLLRRSRLFRKRENVSGDEIKGLFKNKRGQSIEQKGPNRVNNDEVQKLKNERTRIIAAYNRILEHNGLLPDSMFYHFPTNWHSFDIWLQCPILDCIVQTYTEGHGNAANKKDSGEIKDDHQNLRNGVNITNGIKHTKFPQYFELVFYIKVDEPLEETKHCLEITIYSGENKGKANTICIRLGICSKCPKPYMCLLILKDGKNALHQRTTIQNKKDFTEMMKLSAMFNKNKLRFFETGKGHICTLNLSQEKSNWSISGESIETCTVEFVSGFDIDMTSEMLAVIKPYAVN